MTIHNQKPLLYLLESRTLYIGAIKEISIIKLGASCLIFSLGDDFSIRINHSITITAKSALIPAGSEVELEHNKYCYAVCYLEPMGRDFLQLKKSMQDQVCGVFFNSKIQSEQITVLKQIKNDRLNRTEAGNKLLNQVFQTSNLSDSSPQANEIEKVIAIIKSNPCVTQPNSELASIIGISQNKLQRLFKSTTGIPIRRYRLWHRVLLTASLMEQGFTLTEAAIQTGFSDSSHFNHTFKSMLGIAPSTLFHKHHGVEIVESLEPA